MKFRDKINLQCQESSPLGFVPIFVKKKMKIVGNVQICFFFFQNHAEFLVTPPITLMDKKILWIPYYLCWFLPKKFDCFWPITLHFWTWVMTISSQIYNYSDTEIFANHMPDKISSRVCHLNLMMSRCKSYIGRQMLGTSLILIEV